MHVRAMEAPEGENPGFFLAEGMTAPAERVPDREGLASLASIGESRQNA
jgi:hypothetical protein